MNYNEIYLLVLGLIALIGAGLIIFTVNKTSKYRYGINKNQQGRHDKRHCKES